MAQTAGHWGIWGIYEPPEDRPTLAIWEQYLRELRGVEFANGAVADEAGHDRLRAPDDKRAESPRRSESGDS